MSWVFLLSQGDCLLPYITRFCSTITMKKLIVSMAIAGLAVLGMGQDSAPKQVAPDGAPKQIAPADAKNHVGENVTVCGKVVDTRHFKYGVVGHGKPVAFDLDQPEPNPVFYFIAFGTGVEGEKEVTEAYKDKKVCVTGKVSVLQAGTAPDILAPDRSQITVQAASK